ncbi:MAG: HDIG domain-containing protein [Firmicutes bacterium]|nr:HDIG domain-containing protein [Bacillota bacterium]
MLSVGRIRGKMAAVLSMLVRQRTIRRGGAALLFLVAITFIISVDFVPEKNDLTVGYPSPKTFEAEKGVVFEDRNKTEELRRRASEAVKKVYEKDPKVSAAVLNDITELGNKVREVQGDAAADSAAKTARLKAVLPFTINEADLAVLARSAPKETEIAESFVKDLITQAMEAEEGVSQEKLEETKKSIDGQLAAVHLARPFDEFALGLNDRYLRPNAFVNHDKTRQKQEEAANTVPPAMVTVKAGEKIIGKGEILTEDHLAKLQALGLTRQLVPFKSIIGIFLLITLLMGVVLCYIYQQNREIYEHAGHLYLLGIIVLVILAIGKAIVAIDINRWPELGAQFGYMVPLAAAGMLIAILLDSRLAILVVAITSLLLGIMTGNQLRFDLVGLMGGITGVYSVSKLSQRGDLVRAGIYTSASIVSGIMIVGLINGLPIVFLLTSSLSLGLINGILSSIVTNGALPFLESTFRLTSPVRLLELSHPNNELLKRLLTEAPGTYHHSIIVANLAEAAADAVKGESLLVRVGAYYHDIGKVKRPYFCAENQMDCDNPHDKIAPTLSTLILTSHVKDGVEMAKEHKLPQGIIDIIEQHHGSGLVSYFYHKALEGDRTETISEEEFRYEGPKPRSREAAIVMLADSVEAAVRSLQNRTPGRIEGLVRKIIKDKLNDGQLEESDLTFKDLNAIANAFVRVLSGIFHSRVEYPDMSQEMERRHKNAGTRKQLAGKSSGG